MAAVEEQGSPAPPRTIPHRDVKPQDLVMFVCQSGNNCHKTKQFCGGCKCQLEALRACNCTVCGKGAYDLIQKNDEKLFPEQKTLTIRFFLLPG